jgi:hypothetical protein
MGNVVQSDIKGIQMFINELDKGTLAQMGLKTSTDQFGQLQFQRLTPEEDAVFQSQMGRADEQQRRQFETKVKQLGDPRLLAAEAAGIKSRGKAQTEVEKESIKELGPVKREEAAKDAKSQFEVSTDLALSPKAQQLEVEKNRRFAERFRQETDLVLEREAQRIKMQKNMTDEQKVATFNSVTSGLNILEDMIATMDAGGPVTISEIQSRALQLEAEAGMEPGTSALSRLVEAKVGGEAVAQERKLTSRQFADATISDDLDVTLVNSDESDSDAVRAELRSFRKDKMERNFQEFLEVSGLKRKQALIEYKKRMRKIINRTKTIEVRQGESILGIEDTDVIREVEKFERALKALR